MERGKPAPDIFLKAADMLGLKCEECIVIEDSPAGIKTEDRAKRRNQGCGGSRYDSL